MENRGPGRAPAAPRWSVRAAARIRSTGTRAS